MEIFEVDLEKPTNYASILKLGLKKLSKPICKVFLFSVCLTVAGWQTILCIKKYAASPQGVNIEVEDVSRSMLDLSFCVPKSFNETILQECGINNYFNQWSSKLCQDTEKLYEKVWLPSKHFIKYASGTMRSPYTFKWFNVADLKRIRPNCFTIPINDSFDRVSLRFESQATVYAHPKGNFNEDKGIEIGDKLSNIDVELSYEVIQKQQTDTHQCVKDVSYIKEACIWDELNRKSMTAYGCTTPFGPTKHICRDRQNGGGKMALKLYNKYFMYNNHSCKDSCNRTLIHYDILKREDDGVKGIRINFPKQVKVYTSNFTYSFLSLMAEIGGHVGLFLGFSVMDVLTIWTHFFRE